MKKFFEYAAYISLTIAALLASYTIIDQHFIHPPLQAPQSAEALLGKQIPLNGPTWRNARYSVVIALTSECHFCHESLSFYRQLAALESKAPGQFQIVAVSPESKEITQKYLADNQVPTDGIESIPLSTISVSGTPTVFIVDSTGKIRKTFVGKLPEDRQRDLIALITHT